jgi:hypothetical protein
MAPLKVNSDGSLPMWLDEYGRPHLEAEVETALTTGGEAAPAGPHDHDGTYEPLGHTHAAAGHPDAATHVSLGLAATSHAHPHAHSYASNTHTHILGDTTGLQPALDGKAATHAHPYEASGAVATHAGLADPHPGYLTTAEGNAAFATSAHVHAPVALTDGDIPASIARDTEVSAAITAHLAAATHGGEGGGFQFPVGALYFETTGVNPGTTFGYGTWAAFGVGRFLLGTDTQAGVTGGAASHTHAAHTGVINHTHPVVDPGHTHVQQRFPTATGGSTGFTVDTSMSGTPAAANVTASGTTGVTTSNPAGGVASLTHDTVSNEPPSITAFIWQRTA